MENPFAKYVQDNPSVASENPFAKYTADQQAPETAQPEQPQAPSKEKADLADAAKSGFYSGMANLGKGAAAAYMGLQEALPEWARRSDYDPDKMGKAIQEADEYYKTKSKEALKGKETGYGGAFVSGAAQVPFYAPLLAPMSIAGQGFERGQEVMDAGGDLKTALAAHGVSTLTNAVFQGLPVSLRGTLTKRFLSGVGLGTLGVPVEPALVNAIRKAAGLEPIEMPELKDYFAGAGLGGGAGAAFGARPKKAGSRNPNDAAIDAELAAAKAADEPPKPATQETPPPPPPAPETPLPNDIPFNEITNAVRERQMTALPEEPAREAPLPVIRELPTDTVPYLPGTEPKPAPNPPLEPLHPTLYDQVPRAEKPAKDALPTVEGLSELPPLLPEEKPGLPVQNIEPQNPFLPGTAPVHVPTLDTPLPKIDPTMVGDQPPVVPDNAKVKEALPRFADRFAKAKSEAGRNKVERDFQKFMTQNGVDPTTTSKLFDYQVRGSSGSAFLRAKGGAGKKQGGAISPDLLGIGKASELLGRLGSKGLWEKFKGTFHARAMAEIEDDVKDPKSRSTVVWMSPDDFLALAKKRGGNEYLKEEKRGPIREGMKSEEGLRNIPFLWTENGGNGEAQVYGHEGRHRADVFKEQGVDLMPVIVRDATNRWGEAGNPYIRMVSEDGDASRPFPTPIFQSFREQARDALKRAMKDVEVDEVSTDDWLKSAVYRSKVVELMGGVGGKQGGAIDPQVYKEGMKRLTRALSRLTDKGWVKAKFPEDKYETNGDGTPLIMLHGTKERFPGDLQASDQGIHLGFVVPAHVIKAPGEMYTRPKRAGTELRIHEERIRHSVEEFETKFNALGATLENRKTPFPLDETAVRDKVAKQAENIEGVGNNIRPVVLKKGNYPFIDKDIGIWRPLNVMTDLKLDLEAIGRQNGKPPMLPGRWEWYRNKIRDAAMDDISNGTQEANKYFTQFLKEFGIDGIFYKNTGESLNKTTTSSDGHRFLTKIQNARRNHAYTNGLEPPEMSLQHPISFVTWDEGRIESLFVDKPVDKEALAKWAKATKQGGALHIDDITQGISKMVQAVKGTMRNPSLSMAEEATPDHQRAAMSRVPGLSALKGYIPKDIDPAYIVGKIKEMGDIKNAYHSLIGSKEMIESIKNHPAVFWIASRFTNARKRADLYHREYLKPLEETVLKMTQDEEGARLAHVMKKEMFAKKRLDDGALKRIGLSDREISVYNKMRKEFDAAFDRLNAYRQANGDEPLTRHQAYLSSRWHGDWKTPVFDKKGRLVWYIAETSKGKAEHALAWLKKNHPDLDISKSKVKYSKDFFFTEDSMTLSTYADMVRMLGKNDPAVKAMEEYNNARLEGEGETLLGHNKHFQPKAGVRGFLGDRPWVNDQKNTRDLLKAQLAYLRNTHTWVELQKAVDDTNNILTNKEVREVAPNLVELMQDLKRAEMGYATLRGIGWMERHSSKALSEATSWMGKLFPPLRGMSTDLGSINTGMGWAKAYFYLMKLGMVNVPFAAMSLVQPIFTLPHHVRLTGEGYNHNFLKTWVDVMGGTAGATKAFATGDMGWLSGVQKEAYKYMAANAIGDLNQYAEAHDIGLPYAAERIKTLGGKTMTETERLSRTMAFMGYVSHLDQSGKFRGRQQEMFQLAEKLTDKSMANYRHTERAGLFNKTGLVGTAAATLQTFKINQINQMYDLAKYAKRTGDYKPFASLIMTQWLMAGALGMYGLDEIEDMWTLLKKGLVELGVADKELLAWSPKKMIADNLWEWAAYGIPSSVHNRNWSNRMSQANIVDLSFAGMFPFLADYGKQIVSFATVLKDLVTGSSIEESGARAIHAALPSSVKSYYEMHSPLTDQEGNPYPTTKDPRQLQYRRTEFDKSTKDNIIGGMQSLDEAKGRTSEYQYKQFEGNVQRLQQVLSEEFEGAVRQQDFDKASKLLLKYVHNDGDWRNLVRQIDDDLMKTMFTEEEWQAMKSMDGQQAMKRLIRRLEFKGVR